MNSIDLQRRKVIGIILVKENQGDILSEEEISQSDPSLYKEACELFGDWSIALEYAGVRIRQKRSQNPVPATVIQRIRRRVGILNSVKATQIRKSDYNLYRAGILAFGSWHRALDAAGVDRDRLYFGPSNPRLDKEQIVELLRARVREGRSMRFRDFACDNMAVARAITARFGSWHSALVFAGLRQERKLEESLPLNAPAESQDHIGA